MVMHGQCTVAIVIVKANAEAIVIVKLILKLR